MNHVFFSIMWMVKCVFVAYMENWWYCDVLGNVFVWATLGPAISVRLLAKYTPLWKRYSLMAAASFSKIKHSARHKKCFKNALKNTTSLRCCL